MAGLVYQGSKSLGSAIPIALVLNAALGSAGAEALRAALAELDGALAVQFATTFEPPGLALAIAGNAAVALSLTAGSPPAWPSLMVEIIAALELKVAELRALLELGAVLSQGAIHLYTYTGSEGSFSAEVTAEIGGAFPGSTGSAETFAVVLAAVDSSSIATLRAAFQP